MVILIQGAAGAGKSLLAKWLGKAHAEETVTVLEHSEVPNARRALAKAKRDNKLVICTGDWPDNVVKADMEIWVRRGTEAAALRCNNRRGKEENSASNARLDE